MKSSIPRLRRVRFKDGRTVEVLRFTDASERIRKSLASCTTEAGDSDVGKRMDGYALVCWSADGDVFVKYENNGRLVPGGGVPQYVKDVLLAEVAVRWTF